MTRYTVDELMNMSDEEVDKMTNSERLYAMGDILASLFLGEEKAQAERPKPKARPKEDGTTVLHSETPGRTFGQVLDALAHDPYALATRKGWNGKEMFIYLVKGRVIRAPDWKGPSACLKKLNINGVEERGVVLNDHIDMRCADGTVCVGWLASQADMTATDWKVIRQGERP